MKALIIFLLILLVGGVIAVGYYQKQDSITLGPVQISSSNLKTLTDEMPENSYYALCSLKKEDGDAPCVTMLKRELE